MLKTILLVNKIKDVNESYNMSLITLPLTKLVLVNTILLCRGEIVMGAIPISAKPLVDNLDNVRGIDTMAVVSLSNNHIKGDSECKYTTHTPYMGRDTFVSVSGAEFLISKGELEDTVIDPMVESWVSIPAITKRYSIKEGDLLESLDLMVSLDPNLANEVGIVAYANDYIVYKTLELNLTSLVFCLRSIMDRGLQHNGQTKIDVKTIYSALS